MDKKTVLVADDDGAIRTVLNQALMRAGFDVRVTTNISTLWQWVSEGQGHVVVSDVIMPDGDAFELLPRIKKLRPNLPVILISAQNTLMTAIKAQEAGVYEYLPKPFDLDDLTGAAKRASDELKDNRPVQSFEQYSQNMPLVGRSQAMQEIYRSIARLMNSDFPIMICGASGTGKSLTARVLHDFGARKDAPFIKINLATLPADKIEEALFGDQTGKHSFLDQAISGTLYIEQIDKLPDSAQSRMLSHLLELEDATNAAPSKVRIIASTQEPMENAVANGTFRGDLFYRLNVVPLNLLPLSKRAEDIPDLARHFLRLSETSGTALKHFDETAFKALKLYSWPGNIRELENLMRRICILYPQETITESVISSELRSNGRVAQTSNAFTATQFENLREATRFFVDQYFDEVESAASQEGIYQHFLQEFEQPLITAALTLTNGNKIKAAKLLGLNRNTLHKKIAAHNIKIIKTAR